MDEVSMVSPVDPLQQLVRRNQKKRNLRYHVRLRTVLVIITFMCAGLALLQAYGFRILQRLQATSAQLQVTPIVEVLAVPALALGVLAAIPIGWLTYRSKSGHGFLVFAVLSCLGVVGLIACWHFGIAEIWNLNWDSFERAHLLPIGLAVLAIVLPVAAFVGWFLRNLRDVS